MELSAGLFQAADVARDRLGDELARLAPSECLCGEMASTAEAAPLLERLSPRERQIVVFRFFDGMSQSEIATRVGLSQMHVSRLLTRALEKLRGLAGTSMA